MLAMKSIDRSCHSIPTPVGIILLTLFFVTIYVLFSHLLSSQAQSGCSGFFYVLSPVANHHPVQGAPLTRRGFVHKFKSQTYDPV
jgi:hypothetical protein